MNREPIATAEPGSSAPAAHLVGLPRRIGPGSAGIFMTPEEFDDLPEWRWVRGFRYELIRGVLVVSPVAGPKERGPNDVLGYLLRSCMEASAGCPLDETLPEQYLKTTPDRRRCDRAIWIGLGRLPDDEVDVPAIVVEFVSKRRRDATRDYATKRDEYGRLGVQEYWVIDRFHRRMTVYKYLPGLEAPRVVTVGEPDEYRTDLLPGFSLPLRRLLPAPDASPKRPKRRRRDRD
jgi:Uma2 family endonuclease